MTRDNLIYNNNISPKYINSKINKKLNSDFSKILQNIIDNIDNRKDTFHVLSKNFKLNFKPKDFLRFRKFQTIVIIGMGGSILGAETIYQFLGEKIKKKIYFLDDLDENKSIKLKKKLKINKTLFLVISKSGDTIETLSNFLFFNIIRRKSKNIILISENKNNFLHSLSRNFDLFYIEHKNYIGGRYSVLSEVGIVPAYLMGVNINRLRANIRKFLKTKGRIFLKESSIKLSNLLQQKIFKNLVFLNYSPKLEKFLFWCQQLIAESLGKKNQGFLPVISNVPKDHHSLLQLYLDGPKDKLFCIFSASDKLNRKLVTKRYFGKVEYLRNKSLSQIKQAQKKALIDVFQKKNIPFREFKINKMNEESLGELFSYYILETAIIGKLSKINPFDQPAVEQVKILTKKILK